jgi:hypothetical protein
MTRVGIGSTEQAQEDLLMKQYLLSVYHPDVTEGAPPPADIEQIMADVGAVNDELRAAGAWVFAGGLYPSSTATVLKLTDGEVLVTDGPFLEAKEHIGGVWVINAPDLDAALGWGRKAARACRIPVEVRPFQEEPQD